jgi:very-short-patch-repair endonuclease
VKRSSARPKITQQSTAEENFERALQSAGVDIDQRQFKFHATRKWRFDFAWPQFMLAVEIDGGIFSRGRHVSPGGFIADCEKTNAAALDGWTVLRFPVVGGMEQMNKNALIVRNALADAKVISALMATVLDIQPD